MRKGILYAILLLTIGVIASNAFAWTTWPHEDCNTWAEINASTYTITQPGCYVIETSDASIYINGTLSNVSIDLNGHGASISADGSNIGVFELYSSNQNNQIQSSVNVYYVDANNLLIHDLRTLSTMYADNLRGNTIGIYDVSAQGGGEISVSAGTATLSDVNIVSIGIQGITNELNASGIHAVSLSISGQSDANIYLSNSDIQSLIPSGIPASRFVVTNVTSSGFPVEVYDGSSTPSTNIVYIADSIPSNAPAQSRWILTSTPGTISNFSGYIYASGIPGTVSDSNIVYTHLPSGDVTAQFSNSDIVFYYSLGSYSNIVFNNLYLTNSQIHLGGIGVSNISADQNSTIYTSSIDLYAGSSPEYNFPVIRDTYGDIMISSYIYDNNTVFAPKEISTPLLIIYPAGDKAFIISGSTITADQSDSISININGGTIVFRNVQVPQNKTVHLQCTSPATVYFEGTTTADRFVNDGGCTIKNNAVKPNLTISTNQHYEEVDEGTPVEFNVTVTSENAPEDNVVVRAIADNYYNQFDQNKEIVIPHLDANQSKTITFEFNLQSSPGTYKLTATVDPDNQIEESDETDNTTTRFYVNVIREFNSCPGTISTGMYRLTTHLSDVNDGCIVVPSDATVYLSAGAGIEGQSEWTNVIINNGNLQIGGMWGKGRIYNSGTGTLTLYYLQKMNSTGFFVYNDGTLYLGSHNEIPFLMQTGGTIKVMGTDNTVNEYTPYDFAGNKDLKFSLIGGTLSINGYESNHMTSTIYADQPINDPTGVYVYLDQQPSFAQGVNAVRGIIIGDGLSAAFDGKTIGAIFVGGKNGVSQDLNISNSHIIGSAIMLDNQPNQNDLNYPIYARFDNTEIRLSDGITANGAITYFTNSTVSAQYARYFKASEMYVKDSEINIPHFNIYVPSDVNLQIYVDLSDGDSTIDFGEIQSGTVTLHCVGDHTLHLAQWMLDSNKVTIDPSCYQNIDYTKNLRVSVSAPSSVPTDSNYSITVTVYNDAKYTTLHNVPVVVYIDDVPVYETNVDVPPEGNTSFEVTAHSSSDVGTANIRVVVDPDNQIPEANEQDNVATTSVAIEAHTAPSSAPAPVVGAGGNAGLSATSGIFVSAKVGEETETAIHVYWKYGFPVTANITYIPEGGKIYGPDTVKLHTGDNIIKVKVVPQRYGEVGKVIVSAMNEHSTVTLYARPLAQLAIPNIDARVVVILALVGYLVWALLV